MSNIEADPVAMMRDRMSKFGVLGAGVVQDSMATVQVAALVKETEGIDKVLESQPIVAEKVIEEVSRDELIAILRKVTHEQDETALKINDIIHDLSEDRKKPQFKMVYEIVETLEIPSDLGNHGFSDKAIHAALEKQMQAEDAEVGELMQSLYLPGSNMSPEHMAIKQTKIDQANVDKIDVGKLLDIHRFMLKDLYSHRQYFARLSQEERWALAPQNVEKTIEILVAVAVEIKYNFRSEEVEAALISLEDSLRENEELQQINEQISSIMSNIMSMTKPRVSREELLTTLGDIKNERKKAKAMMKGFSSLRKIGRWNWTDCYNRLEKLRTQCVPTGPDMEPLELRTVFSQYATDPEVYKAWEESGADMTTSFALLCQFQGQIHPSQLATMGPAGIPFMTTKKADVTPAKLLEAQLAMVEQLKLLKEEVEAIPSSERSNFQASTMQQLVQGLASSAIEDIFGLTAEEMVVAGFQQAMIKAPEQAFQDAAMEQQKVLTEIGALCQGDAEACTIM